ncbi:family M23 zinc metallopeptidase with OapA domain protein [Alishewanella longhuensis]|uniref:Family M23 zinc metallopeptidase with OapA domain protein n=1 Tax=Alishewanella longhuensis TaxID=1091037 RepID=A0ABQ3KVY5_9ALTE|nr:peptidoglycan DD-metalloendopeptidase family protein [Alishewanella longhuensis]GHG64910.1 family M23 zinc metallopeptidase with OapA domain protein [Alishewanella longhuensis]
MQQLVAQIPSRHRLLIVLVSVFIAILLLLPSERAAASRGAEQSALEVGKRYSVQLDLPEETSLTALPELDDSLTDLPPEALGLNWTTLEVQPGDILSTLFRKANVNQQTMLQILDLGKTTRTLTRLFPGEKLEFGLDEQGELQQLRYAMDRLTTLQVSRQDNGRFKVAEVKKAIEQRQQFATAEIRSSFWNAGLNAGLSEAQIMLLAGIFGWDIDFALDLRAGDSFSVIFNAEYVEGEYLGRGQIIAAQFSNQGQVYQAIRHTDGNFYKPDGNSMRQAFLRAPVSFQYVSSNFNPRRLHPVLGTVRAHNGTDYVAPVGTPIMAAGDGRVTHSAYNGVNGHYVFIQHANNIVTKYLHLSKRDVKSGDRVRQGQTIGRLGATGRVTGAHLHYEFLQDGVHRNPRTVKLPQATPLSGAERQAFQQQVNLILGELQSQQQAYLAKQNSNNTAQSASN